MVLLLYFQDSCLVLSMLAFFFYLAVFFWMLVEGGYIYLMIDVMKAFRGNAVLRRRIAFLVGWGKSYYINRITVSYHTFSACKLYSLALRNDSSKNLLNDCEFCWNSVS